MRDCSDIGKASLGDVVECQEARSELGVSYWSDDVNSKNFPKACVYYNNKVYWNAHETGASNGNNFPICRNDGKCNDGYRIELYNRI